ARFTPVPFPRRRDLLLPLDAASLDWTDFARLHRCDMGDLAGYRNSGLGRLMDALRRLEYEQAWIKAGSLCLQQVISELEASSEDRQATRVLLERLLADKQRQLSAVLWNAVFGHPALQRWHTGGSQAPDQAVPTNANSAAANHLLTLRDQAAALSQLEAQPQRIEQALIALAQSRRVGEAQQQWAAARALLGQATRLLQDHGANVCRNGRPTPAARRLKNVFRQFYVAIEQPRLAATVTRDAPWVQAFAALPEVIGSQVPPALQQWLAVVLDPHSEQSHWRQTKAAFVAHSRAWQTLAEQCRLSLFD
ncbi:MAG: DUF3080 family protein, partial [Pseudomonadales bacterium]